MRGRLSDLTGKKFNRLFVIKRAENDKQNHAWWLCRCDCGVIKKVQGSCLVTNNTQSCGCLGRELHHISGQKRRKHGHGNPPTKTYSLWNTMRGRCNNPNSSSYKYYGARGIKVCERWSKFKNFLADMGEKPNGLTIDRIDNDGNYEKDNCRWVTAEIQNQNSRRAKLDPLKVQVIKKLLKESNLKQPEIAEIFHVATPTINHINTGRHWSNIIYTPELP